MEGLNHAAGFLQARVAARLQTRFTPVLSFHSDDRVKKSIEIGRLIDEAVASDQRGEASPVDSSPGRDRGWRRGRESEDS